MTSSTMILETNNLRKSFKGFEAVCGISLAVEAESIHSIIGPNGAGKTTFFNLLSKFISPTSGTVSFEGGDITALRPAQIARLGMVRSFQISSVIPSLSVLDNLRLALMTKDAWSWCFWRSRRVLDRYTPACERLLQDVGLDVPPEVMAGSLSYGQKRALEIATTLALDPKLMLLDEPTQGLGHEDIGRIAELIKKVSVGRTTIIVEHNMRVVSGISDRVTVLQRGTVIADGSYAQVASSELVQEAYLGKESADTEEAHA